MYVCACILCMQVIWVLVVSPLLPSLFLIFNVLLHAMEGGEDWLLSWLANLNLTEYYSVFNQLGLHAPDLLANSTLDRDQLKNIGVTKMGHMNRLIRAIDKLRVEEAEVCVLPQPTVTPSLHQAGGDFSKSMGECVLMV